MHSSNHTDCVLTRKSDVISRCGGDKQKTNDHAEQTQLNAKKERKTWVNHKHMIRSTISSKQYRAGVHLLLFKHHTSHHTYLSLLFPNTLSLWIRISLILAVSFHHAFNMSGNSISDMVSISSFSARFSFSF